MVSQGRTCSTKVGRRAGACVCVSGRVWGSGQGWVCRSRQRSTENRGHVRKSAAGASWMAWELPVGEGPKLGLWPFLGVLLWM